MSEFKGAKGCPRCGETAAELQDWGTYTSVTCRACGYKLGELVPDGKGRARHELTVTLRGKGTMTVSYGWAEELTHALSVAAAFNTPGSGGRYKVSNARFDDTTFKFVPDAGSTA